MRILLIIFVSVLIVCNCPAQVVTTMIISTTSATDVEDETKWYVSNDGDDGNTGHGESPLQTIAGLMTKTLQEGDSVFFNKGDTWYGESLTITTNNVVVSSYGTGALPIISGGEVLTTWIQNGNVWAAGVSGTVYNFYVNGTQQTLARYPSTGNWFRCDAGTTTAKVVSDDLTGSSEDEYLGATLRVRSGAWKYDTPTINSSKDDSVSVSTVLSYTPSSGYGFYMTGLPAFLDTCLEYYSDGDSIWYYPGAGVNPNEETCIASVRETGVTITGSYVTVNGLQFEKQSVGVKSTGTPQYLTVNGCTIKDQWTHGIHFTGAGSWHTISDNIITDVNACGINLYFSGNSTISGDSLDRIGIVPGLYTQPFGIIAFGDTCVISGNRLDSIGYSGIYPGDWDVVYDNVVCNTLMSLEDGGGIYSGGDTGNRPTNIRIYNNIVENVVGYQTSSGTTYPNTTVGIYLDAFTRNSYVGNNTIKGTMQFGIFTQYNSITDTIWGNTFYDITGFSGVNWYDRNSGIKLLTSSVYNSEATHVVKYNTFFSSDTTWHQIFAYQVQDSAFVDFGENDYNKYLNQHNQNRLFLHQVPSIRYNFFNLSVWQDTTGDDANAEGIWRQWLYTSQDKDSLFMNKFSYPYTYTIAENTWKDYEGTIHGTTLTVPADSAILLFNSPDSDSLLAQYSETNQDADGLMSISNGTSQRAMNVYGDGNYITGFDVYAKKVGTGAWITPKIYANTGTYGSTSRPTGSALVTSDSINVSAWSTDFEWHHIQLTTPYKTTNGTIYHAAITTWAANNTNCVNWGRDSSSPTYAGNPAYGTTDVNWSQGTSDQCFRLYTQPSP